MLVICMPVDHRMNWQNAMRHFDLLVYCFICFPMNVDYQTWKLALALDGGSPSFGQLYLYFCI